MSRVLFDQLSKQLMEELLSPFGQVEISREVSGEPRFVDVWFQPRSSPTLDPSTLGLLGRFTTHPCLIEPFRNAPSQAEAESCWLKLYSIRTELRREARKEKRSLSEQQLPVLWILSPTASASFLEDLGGQEDEDWPQGVYFSISSLHTRVIAIHQLPETDETLWLRLLGKGGTQRRAIQEVIEFSRSDPRRAQALKLLISWKVTIETSEERDEEGELAMALSQAYLQWERETEQRGLERGKQEAILETLIDTLEFRFQQVPAELIEQLRALSADRLRVLHREALGCTDLEAFSQLISRDG